MQEEIFKFVSATFGVSAAVALAVILLSLWLVYFITKKVTLLKAEHGSLAKSMERAEADNKEQFGKVDKKFDHIEGKIDEIRRDLSYIKGNMDFMKSGGSNLIQSHSPVYLTEEGKNVATQMGAEEMIDRNWEKIRNDIRRSGLDNAYDIQEYCFMTASVSPDKFLDETSMSKVKQIAFENGKSIQVYLRILALMVRDRYLNEEHIAIQETM